MRRITRSHQSLQSHPPQSRIRELHRQLRASQTLAPNIRHYPSSQLHKIFYAGAYDDTAPDVFDDRTSSRRHIRLLRRREQHRGYTLNIASYLFGCTFFISKLRSQSKHLCWIDGPYTCSTPMLTKISIIDCMPVHIWCMPRHRIISLTCTHKEHYEKLASHKYVCLRWEKTCIRRAAADAEKGTVFSHF